MNKFWQRGEPLVWFSGSALAAILLIMATLMAVVVTSGLGVFWPHRLAEFTLADGGAVMGEVIKSEPVPGEAAGRRIQLKIGNRDLYALDFRWIDETNIVARVQPEDAVALERMEYGNFYGRIREVNGAPGGWAALMAARQAIAPDLERVREATGRIVAVNRAMESIRLREVKLRYRGAANGDARLQDLADRRGALSRQFDEARALQAEILRGLGRATVVMADAGGRTATVRVMDIVRAYRPNQMSLSAKAGFYLGKIGELLLGQPRESNTEGGLYPAIFGTILLVFLMSLLCFPLGVVAGIYLREYARQGAFVRLVRIAVNNLAGIPSIVYGVFGLGFFVYGIGGAIDRIFFPERLPTPTFGTGGILWAGLTLGLLTVPVVIVATEEAFGAIPRGIREASMALGATQFQTLRRVLFPMALPGMITGFILAMARAAGEVAPLMITGVVKLAPALPIDAQFPFLHLDRKFMHLGFHIYDIGFQSPNVEAAKPMVFVTTLLLVLVVLVMSSAAIHLRRRMARKYAVRSF